MSNKFQLKRTSVSGRTPNTTTSSNTSFIDAGELAVNLADRKLFSSNGVAAFEVGSNLSSLSVTGTATLAAISANGSIGSTGQVLTSNGTSTYWDMPASAVVPSAGNGLTSNTTHYAVLANTGVIANATGTYVNAAYIATISANNASFLEGYTWAAPAAIGTGTANSATFTNLSVTGNTTLGDAAADTVTINANTITITANSSIDAGTLYIDTLNNKVGVGTTTPGRKLAVSGDGIIIDNGTSTAVLEMYSSTDFRMQVTTDWQLYDVTNTATRLFVSSNGNVGVGNTTPANKLAVAGDVYVAGAGSSAYYNTINNSGLTSVSPSGAPIALRLVQTGIADWSIYNEATTGNLRVGTVAQFSTNGNVGIGTTTPVGKLDVSGITYLGSDTNNSLFVNSNTSMVTIGAAGRSTFSTSALAFITSNGSAALERMRINSDGYLGIGINPSYFADINSPVQFALRVAGPSGVYSDITDGTTTLRSQVSGSVGFVGTATNHPFSLMTNSTSRVRITSGGNVGISNTSPAHTLSVTGTTNISGNATFGQDVTISGNLVVSGATTTVNTTNLDVTDAVIRLNSGQATPLNDIGILMQRYATANSTNYNVGFAWDEGSDRLIFGTTPEAGADNDLSFSTEWMTITSNGNVGIGTSTPVSTAGYGGLTLNGDTGGILSFAGLNTEYLRIFGRAADSWVFTPTATPLVLGTNSAEGARLDANGRFMVGIAAALNNNMVSAYGTDRNGFVAQVSNNVYSTFQGFNASTTLSFQVDGSGNGYFAGNVGIGVSSPTLQLQIGTRGGMTSGGVFQWGQALTGNNRGVLSWDTNVATVGAPQNLVFCTNSETTERVRIDTSGNVGIGTNSPSAKLDVNGTGYFSDNVLISRTNTAGSLSGLTITNAGNTSAYAGMTINSGTVSSQFFNDAAGNAVVAGAVLRTTSNHPLVIGTNNTERMRITSAGDVGIGNSSPSERLHVITATGKAFVKISSTDNTGNTGISFSGAGDRGSYYADANYYHYIEPNAEYNNPYVIIKGKNESTYSVRVGIGTNSPGAKVHVDTGAATGTSLIIGAASATSSQINMGIGVVTAGRPFIGTNTNTNPLEIGTRSAIELMFLTNATERMRIDSNGNVGIGTTPNYKLDVSATGTISGQFKTSGGINALYLADAGTTDGTLYIGTVGNDFRVVTGSSEQMRITGAGNVGIGTTTISQKLTVAGRAQFTIDYPDVRLLTANGYGWRVAAGSNGTNLDKLYFQSTTDGFTGAATPMVIDSNGNVGIGTISPSALLHVKLATDRNARFLSAYSGVALGATTDIGAETKLTFFGNPLAFVTNDTERMRVDASGNVGIGNTSPSNKLFVTGDIGLDGISVRDTATTTTTATTQITLFEYPIATYDSCDLVIKAVSGGERHVAKLLVTANSTVAIATEYGTLTTGAALFTVDVDVSGANTRVRITPASATSTVFKSSYELITS